MLRLLNAAPRKPLRKAGLVSGLLGLVAAIAIFAFPGAANADVLYNGIYRNWKTGGCLDSNYDGNAYMLGCNFGTYQQWRIDHVETMNGYIFGFRIINVQTGRCLDSNGSGFVYTLPCNGGDYQTWWMYGYSNIKQGWQDKATGKMLTAVSGQLGGLLAITYANPFAMNDGAVWRPGF